jgi:YVTN family beta-propeller protein
VADSAVDTLSVIDTADGRALAPIKVGGGPMAVAFSPDGRTSYAIDSQTGQFAVIDVRSRHVRDSFPVGPFPVALSAPAAH